MTQQEDPLVAALPPATDFITYLTLLEYQLNPENLSTLNRLLSEDDGKLAEEIGWDLLRLVLPMLNDVPETVSECLDVIARRGNPREVVIRVAEELEKLGQSPFDGQDASSSDDENGDDGLSTFVGEAKRVHLGAMKLDGMPGSEETKMTSGDEAPLPEAQTLENLSFCRLLDTLETVHPRIKTQYPSRFLATSLPAALGAYRRLHPTYDTTNAFIRCLGCLWERQTPPLPPRGPSDVDAAVDMPLPDPEATSEATSDVSVAVSTNDKATVTRLLQAVLLEVLDEYLSSLQTEIEPSMSWTTRLREIARPERIVPGKQSQNVLWETQKELKRRDIIIPSVMAWTERMKINACAFLKQATQPDQSPAEVESEEEPSEYPTTPAQIPFAQTALVLLAAAWEFYSTTSQSSLDSETIWKIFNALTPLSETPSLPTPAVQDALHTILFHSLSSNPKAFHDHARLTTMVAILTQTFTINPSPQLRDDAHYLASWLIQESTESQMRLRIIKQTLRGHFEETNPEDTARTIPLSTPLTLGSLKAVAVDWLKNEFLQSAKASTSDINSTTLVPSVIDEDIELSDMLFPQVPSVLEATAPNSDTQEHTLLMLPFYISVLNMCCIILANYASSANDTRSKTMAMLESIKLWRNHLLNQMENDIVKQSAPDIYALEDAGRRLSTIIGTSPNA